MPPPSDLHLLRRLLILARLLIRGMPCVHVQVPTMAVSMAVPVSAMRLRARALPLRFRSWRITYVRVRVRVGVRGMGELSRERDRVDDVAGAVETALGVEERDGGDLFPAHGAAVRAVRRARLKAVVPATKDLVDGARVHDERGRVVALREN